MWFPTWATDRLRRSPAAPPADTPSADTPPADTPPADTPPADTPLVTRWHDGRRPVVGCADQAAQSAGLRAGMPLAQAQAMLPGLRIMPADPQADAEALRRLAAWCLRWAPLSCACAPDGIWIDTSGCDHLHGGEGAMLRDMMHRLNGAGIAARIAIADTAGAAHALARTGPRAITLCRPGEQAATIARLPVAALRIAPELAACLHRLGMETVGQIASAARAPLARRFGTDLLRRLDQAEGRVAEPIVPVFPPELVQRRLTFVEPLSTPDAFAHVIGELLRPICEQLNAAGAGARRLDLVFERVDGTAQSIRIGAAAPSRDPAHLARLLRERIDTVEPGLGVEAMRLIVPLSEKLSFVQRAAMLAAEPGHGADLAVLVDRLSNRFGAKRVFQLEPVQSDLPERSLRRVAPRTEFGDQPDPHPPVPARLPRPIRLLTQPEPVMVLAMLPDAPPAAFTWRRVRHRIRQADGPERIQGEWWRHDSELDEIRDYWRVEDAAGQRFWLFRRGDGDNPRTNDLPWFLHGFF